MNLYELGEMYQKLQDSIERSEIPEEAIADTLNGLDEEINSKSDNIACMIKNLESEAEIIEKEAKNLLLRAKTKKQKAVRLREYLKNQLILLDIAKIETKRNKIQIRANPQKVVISDEFLNWAASNADDLLKYSQPVPNKENIKEALKKGREIPYVALKTEQRIDIK